MRREKRLAENEERYRAEQDRWRATKHKRKNTNSSPGCFSHETTAADPAAARVMPVAAVGFLSESGKPYDLRLQQLLTLHQLNKGG